MKTLRISLLLALLASLVACSSDDLLQPSPLVSFDSTIKVDRAWHHNSGTSGTEYLNLQIGHDAKAIYIVNVRGDVQALDSQSGKELWVKKLHTMIRGGVSAGDGLVVVSNDRGDVYALNSDNGTIIWQANVGNIVLAPAGITKNTVIVRTVVDTVLSLDAQTGKILWKFTNNTPSLMLRSGSQPQISAGQVIVGLSSGNIQVIDIGNGVPIWQQPIAEAQGSFDIQRMIDVAASPIVRNGIIYAASYQGNIIALHLDTAQKVWSQHLSSYTGLALGQQRLFITDAESGIWCFDPTTGIVLWHQLQLKGRVITAPSVQGDTIVVGDGQGYVHWLSATNGHFLARTRLSTEAIVSAPVIINNTVYIVDVDGHLAAYQIELS